MRTLDEDTASFVLSPLACLVSTGEKSTQTPNKFIQAAAGRDHNIDFGIKTWES